MCTRNGTIALLKILKKKCARDEKGLHHIFSARHIQHEQKDVF